MGDILSIPEDKYQAFVNREVFQNKIILENIKEPEDLIGLKCKFYYYTPIADITFVGIAKIQSNGVVGITAGLDDDSPNLVWIKGPFKIKSAYKPHSLCPDKTIKAFVTISELN